MRVTLGLAAAALFAVAGLMAYVRLAPDAVALWHVAVPEVETGDCLAPIEAPDRLQVFACRLSCAKTGDALCRKGAEGALLVLRSPQPAALLARLAEVAADQPRTRLLAGSLAEGRITWVARSLIWGFPDYVTAELGPEGLRIWSRQRYGRGDYGVNAARLRRWIGAL